MGSCPLFVALLVTCALASEVTDCTYDEYGSWSVGNNNRQMTLYLHDGMVTVTVVEYGLGTLDFPEGFDNTVCQYDTNNHNGWVVTSSGTNGCVQTVTKDFPADVYNTHCAKMVETASGYEIDTSVTEWTVPLYNGELLDGTPLTVQVQGHFYSEVLLPSSATVSVVATVYGPPQYRAAVNGTAGVFGTTVYADIIAQVNAPYYITGINPLALVTPDDISAVVLSLGKVINKHSWSSIKGLVTIYPDADCKVDGIFDLEFYVSCLDEDPTCDDQVLRDSPSFTASVPIFVPDCSLQTQEVEAFLTIRTYDKTGNFDTAFQKTATVLIDEVITTVGGTPGSNCDCTTDMDVYNWYGDLLGHYNFETDKELFKTTSLVITPLQNKFSAVMDPSVFLNPNGEVVQITATCNINWGIGKKTTVSSTRRYTLRDQPTSAEGNAAFTVGVVEDVSSGGGGGGGGDKDNTGVIVIGVVGGAGICCGVGCVVVVAGFVWRKRRGKNPPTKLPDTDTHTEIEL